jgi:predicted dehydrogenase
MEAPVNIGVIGCGAMGRSVVNRLVKRDPRLKIAALYDPDQRSTEQALREFPHSPAVCSNYREILNMPEVKWVMIASWNRYHCEQVVASFRAGKHVFCQKPLALNLEECIKMRDAHQKSGKMFNLAFTLRYSPHYRKIYNLISEGHIGDIISMEFNETLYFNRGGYIMGDWRRMRENAGTHLLEKCCHDIDMANWMVDSRAKRAASFGGLNFFIPENEYHIERVGENEEGKKAYRSWQGLIALNPFTSDKDIIDNQVAIIEYENGVRATFHTNCNAGIPERRMYILGTEGAIRADVLTGEITLKRIGFETEMEDVSTSASGIHGGGDVVLTGELAESMLDQRPPSVGLREGLESAVTCFAIDKALDTGEVVDLKPMWDLLNGSQ